MNKFIWHLSPEINEFNIMPCGQDIRYIYNSIDNKPIADYLDQNDRVLIFKLKDTPIVDIELEVIEASDSGEITFRKIFEIGDGIDISSIPIMTSLVSQDKQELIRIDDEIYSKIKSLLFTKNQDKTTSRLKYASENKIPINWQTILYGSPGTGKSYMAKMIYMPKIHYITIFHPDYDYASFVGTYKPSIEHQDDINNSRSSITYKFVPQVFAKAYVRAWKEWLNSKDANSNIDTFLVIEEINRGNCAQIFGDIFQLLDRDSDGYSEYCIDVDEDFALYIQIALDSYIENSEYASEICNIAGIDVKDFVPNKIALPPNFYILATMNTSDQSLFPVDSAFRRRWDWKYIKINYDQKEIQETVIQNISDEPVVYKWKDFLKRINKRIYAITQSEDKQIGPFFIIRPENNVITFDILRDKVLFYLWNEIYKDETEHPDNIFKYKRDDEPDEKSLSFSDLFDNDAGYKKILYILNIIFMDDK